MKRKPSTCAAVAQDIIELKLRPTMTLRDLERAFYCIMRRHGIKQGTREGNAVKCDNFDWTAYRILFVDRIRMYFELDVELIGKVPNDLKC